MYTGEDFAAGEVAPIMQLGALLEELTVTKVRTEIGNLVMDKLKDLDEVAYVRFSSVYREFKDVNTFLKELEKLYRDQKKRQ